MRSYILLLLLIAGHYSMGQPQNVEFNYTDGSSMLLGQTDVKRLKKKPFGEWFNEGFKAYIPNTGLVSKLTGELHRLDSITIFMGTWCGDSKREVPRFYKLLKQVNFNTDKVKLICLDRSFQNYKQSPGREEKGQNIHRVPTFILHGRSEELGRIVESPVGSLENDLFTILSGDQYIPNYQVVWHLNKLFDKRGVDYVLAHQDSLANGYKEKVASKYELNTYAYCLFSSFQIPKAMAVYEMNRLIFPGEPIVYYGLGRLNAVLGNRIVALENLKIAHQLAPDNEMIAKQLIDLGDQ